MEIVGHGFLAGRLAPLAPAHPGTVVFAAGVSSAHSTSEPEFAREADLLYQVLERCREDHLRLVYFSTCGSGMYGAGGHGDEEGPVFPSSPYGRHKLSMEGVLRASGVETLVLRLAYTVGWGQRPHQLVPSLLAQIRAGAVRVHHGARRDMIHVADVVTIVDALLAKGVSHDVVNVASGHAVPIEEIVGHLEARLGTVAHKHVQHVTGDRPVSNEKLLALLPAEARPGFAPGYYRTVIDRYLAGRNEAPA
ncbi:SDR family oxidoreductase [Streptomyces sp. JH34]|uniref:NAD-dependent epimerase/dehydratase family protein n=1 Tax=Streptomyces sp. JH34 TaxID=2793633 RepID=UPI0023F8EEFA|nr:SDR family oxidoreductase [Streptomyces sp. JH34]MDF6017379.1 SDR family oxidoreductase [Streptomyces sp. JH34]